MYIYMYIYSIYILVKISSTESRVLTPQKPSILESQSATRDRRNIDRLTDIEKKKEIQPNSVTKPNLRPETGQIRHETGRI